MIELDKLFPFERQTLFDALEVTCKELRAENQRLQKYERLYDAEWKENQTLLKAIEKKDENYVDLSARYQRLKAERDALEYQVSAMENDPIGAELVKENKRLRGQSDRRLALLKMYENDRISFGNRCPFCYSPGSKHIESCRLAKELSDE